jgi:hypothetical protein
MKKKRTFQDYNIEDTFSYKGYKYKVVSRNDTFTFCVRIPGDGFKYGFLNEIKIV